MHCWTFGKVHPYLLSSCNMSRNDWSNITLSDSSNVGLRLLLLLEGVGLNTRFLFPVPDDDVEESECEWVPRTPLGADMMERWGYTGESRRNFRGWPRTWMINVSFCDTAIQPTPTVSPLRRNCTKISDFRCLWISSPQK